MTRPARTYTLATFGWHRTYKGWRRRTTQPPRPRGAPRPGNGTARRSRRLSEPRPKKVPGVRVRGAWDALVCAIGFGPPIRLTNAAALEAPAATPTTPAGLPVLRDALPERAPETPKVRGAPAPEPGPWTRCQCAIQDGPFVPFQRVSVQGQSYVLVKKIGCGATGAVYMAIHEADQAVYALKHICLRPNHDAASVMNAMQELDILRLFQGNAHVAQLVAAHVVSPHEALIVSPPCPHAHSPTLRQVLEYGTLDLGHMMKDHPAFNVYFALHVFSQVGARAPGRVPDARAGVCACAC